SRLPNASSGPPNSPSGPPNAPSGPINASSGPTNAPSPGFRPASPGPDPPAGPDGRRSGPLFIIAPALPPRFPCGFTRVPIFLSPGGGGWGSGNRDGQSGNSLYFHTVHNDAYSGITNRVFPGITPGNNYHLHVTVVGNTYSVYLDHAATPAVTLTTPDFPTGRV